MYISVLDEASDFKFGTQLGFPKAYHKITLRGKNGGWLWARGASQTFGVSYNISATAGVRDFKFGTQLGFAETHHKTTPKGKVGVALG